MLGKHLSPELQSLLQGFLEGSKQCLSQLKLAVWLLL